MITIDGWPWSVEIAGDIFGGNPAELVISAAKLTDNAVRTWLHFTVGCFADLACFGGLSGITRPSSSSAVRLLSDEKPVVQGGMIHWQFASLVIDPDGLTVLLNMLEGTGLEIKTVRLKAGGADVLQFLSVDKYPSATKTIPFHLDNQVSGRNVDVEVIFPGALDPALHERVIDSMLTWRLVGILGGFRRAGLLPFESNFIPLTEPEIVLDALSFSLEKFTAHEGAFDSLINMLVWVSRTITPIEEVNLL